MSSIKTSKVIKETRDYLMITLGVFCYALGWCAFLLPYQISTGGVAGVASIVFFATNIPVDITYFLINCAFLAIALKILGFKFMLKTIYGIICMTLMLRFLQVALTLENGQLIQLMGNGEDFMACVLGSILCGIGLGIVFMNNGSTGGTDIIAAVINKYRDVTLGKILTYCDLFIVASCYFVFYDWRRVVFGFCTLFITYYIMDYFMDRMRQSVQFLIISSKHEEIADAINIKVHRGCTMMKAEGHYAHKDTKVVMCLAKKYESNKIFSVVKNIDPNAFISQSKVIGVFGEGFDKIKGK
ncbi:MAG: YitT family protein [Bacteroidales bacterium]|nr:YitT family protein [Candidatus Minthousia equi]MDO4956205.1 YitT family protein [Bacteroidales bacterium]